jgi:hypothetical protein
MQENFQFTSSGSENLSVGLVTSQSHFWVTADDNFSSTLFFLSPDFGNSPKHLITVYDALGGKVNEARVEFPSGQVGIFDLDCLLGDCRYLQGLRQAHVQVTSPAGVTHNLEIRGKGSTYSISDEQLVDKKHAACFPLTLSAGSANLLAMVNNSKPECLIRARLFTGNRAPDLEIKVPENGCLTCLIEKEFEEFLDFPESGQMQAYLRIITNSSSAVSARLLEKESKSRG